MRRFICVKEIMKKERIMCVQKFKINNNFVIKSAAKDYATAYNNAKSLLIFVVFSASLQVAITVPIPKLSIASSYYYFGGGIPTSSAELYQAQIYLSKSGINSIIMRKNGYSVSDFSYDIYYI